MEITLATRIQGLGVSEDCLDGGALMDVTVKMLCGCIFGTSGKLIYSFSNTRKFFVINCLPESAVLRFFKFCNAFLML